MGPDLGSQPGRHAGHRRSLRAGAGPPVPTGRGRRVMESVAPAATPDATSRMWTARLRTKVFGTFPPEKLLPDRQPAYVASWIYVFGVASIASFIILVATGL